MNVLSKFENATGAKLNRGKTKIFGIGAWNGRIEWNGRKKSVIAVWRTIISCYQSGRVSVHLNRLLFRPEQYKCKYGKISVVDFENKPPRTC